MPVEANLLNLCRQIAVPGIVAAGMTAVVIAGGFDLSVGAVVALAGVLAVGLAPHGAVLACVVALAVGGLCGAANGLLIWYAAVHPLIVTLGMRYLVYSAATIYTHGFIQVNREPSFTILGRRTACGIPISTLIFLGVALAIQILLGRTRVGSVLYAIGKNERATVCSGILTQRFRIFTYVLSGVCAALAGIVLSSRSGSAAPDAGQGYELEAIAAIAIGGVNLLGGSGSLWNTVLGVGAFAVVNYVLVIAKQPYEIHQIVVGLMIVASLAVDYRFRKNDH